MRNLKKQGIKLYFHDLNFVKKKITEKYIYTQAAHALHSLIYINFSYHGLGK